MFSRLLAGPITRFLAWVIDFGVQLVIFYMLSRLMSFLGILTTVATQGLGEWILALYFLIFFAITVGYNMFFEWVWRGQTLGKRLLRLRVVDENGLQLQFSQIAIRNLLRFIDSPTTIFHVIGGVACILSQRAQRLGDFAANTVVIRTPKIAEPDLDQVLTGKYNSLRDYPHLEARLRQRVSAEEARIGLQALLRRNELSPESRVTLFEEIANHYRSLVTFPDEAVLGVADEQYVRNVVDILFRPKGPGPAGDSGGAAEAGLETANSVKWGY